MCVTEGRGEWGREREEKKYLNKIEVRSKVWLEERHTNKSLASSKVDNAVHLAS